MNFRFPITRKSKDLAISIFRHTHTDSPSVRKAVEESIRNIEALPETQEHNGETPQEVEQ